MTEGADTEGADTAETDAAEADTVGAEVAGLDVVAAGEARGELSLARMALAVGDMHHAAGHLAAAIGHAPALPEAHELLAALAARCGGSAVGLFPLHGRAHVGTVVTHAHLLAGTDPDRALALLGQATAYDPVKPWADTPWVWSLAPGRVDPDRLTRVFTSLMRSLGDPASAPVCRANEVYLDLARRVTAGYPEHALLHATAAGVARRLGATGLAVRWGRRAVTLEPSKAASVWYAYALRADGQLEPALQVMREASARNPLDLDLCSDIATWLAVDGRLDEALAVIEDALAVDPSYDCAVYTAHRLRWLRNGDAAHLVALVDFARDHPLTSHEHTDLADCCQGLAWLGRPTSAGDACLDLIEQWSPQRRGTPTSVSLSAFEVPSALTLLRRTWPGVRVTVTADVPDDLVEPVEPGPVLWRYRDQVACPALPPPAQRSAALLAATTAYCWPHPVAAYDRALPLGQLPVGELMALLVHPPQAPAGVPALPVGWWERCTQIFACLGILHCAEPGDGAARRALLRQVAFGVEDWTVEAALFALTVAAWVEPDCREEVRCAVGHRFLAALRAAQRRPVTILASLAALVPLVPGMLPELVALADEVASADEAPAADQVPSAGEAPAAGQVTSAGDVVACDDAGNAGGDGGARDTQGC